MFTVANNQGKEINDSSRFDLVILESDKRGPQIFAYVVAYRKGAGKFYKISILFIIFYITAFLK